MAWRTNPLIYEINTWTWLHDLSQKCERPITLGTVPDEELDALTDWGLDAIWLMGVWMRSPAGRIIALEHPGLQNEYHHALPGFVDEDIVGSPYAIYQYEVDPHLGSRDELAAIRQRLAERDLKLVLDYVPNHTAHDNSWLATNPEIYLHGTAVEMEAQPDHFFKLSGSSESPVVFANGRDPYYPAWTDTAQLNAFSPTMRAKSIDTLRDIATQCDAVRCDMAMLVSNRIFAQTWGDRGGPIPEVEFWPHVIEAVKADHPEFLFMAEVYWGMEWELQQQGFDYTYDKRLYDRLREDDVTLIIDHLRAPIEYQLHLVRMIENHDEGRAASVLGPGRDLAAATLITTLPGSALLHEGQFVGHRVKLPVQLGRRPYEEDDLLIERFYRMLLNEATLPIYRTGTWSMRNVLPVWADNQTHTNLIAYSWQQDGVSRIIVINYSSVRSQGIVWLAGLDLAGRTWTLFDVLHQVGYERDGNDMSEHGLYIDLHPWQAHIFRVEG